MSSSVAFPKDVRSVIQKINTVRRDLKNQFASRDLAIDLLILGAICQEHVLLIGPPGTAKTKLLARFTDLISAQAFHYMLTRFTEPSELFGPVDVEKFKQGVYRVRTENMLPESNVVFLDEVFRGSSPILNSLLTILNERVFFNGAERQPVPLVLMVGASNEVPDDAALQALADRFALRVEVDLVSDDKLEELLDLGWVLEKESIETIVRAEDHLPARSTLAVLTVRDLVGLQKRFGEIQLGDIHSEYVQVIRELRAAGLQLSDRRVVKGLKLIAGAALLRESPVASLTDFWPLAHLWSRRDEAERISSVLKPRLDQAGGSISSVRSPAEILLDCDSIVAHQPLVATSTALGASLMALNRLRLELIRDHLGADDPRQKVEQAIQSIMTRLEPSHV